MTVNELRQAVRDYNLSRFTRYRKDELIQFFKERLFTKKYLLMLFREKRMRTMKSMKKMLNCTC